MTSGWDWAALTEGATDTYNDIDSLERIKPPDKYNKGESRFPEGYPAFGTPNWWALRRRYETLMARKQARLRSQFPLSAPVEREQERADNELGRIASMVAIGSEAATRRYEAIDPETGLHVLQSSALRRAAVSDPKRYRQIVDCASPAKRIERRRIDYEAQVKRA